MRKLIVLACVALGFATSALAGPPAAPPEPSGGKGCQFQGTWFGVDPDTHALTGWMVTVAGQSANQGTNNLEYPGFDASLGMGLPAVRLSTLRGAWQRVGGNEFDYTMIGMAVAVDGTTVWIGKLSGHITLSADCKTEYITAALEVFLDPSVSPFDGEPTFTVPLDPHYGYRASVDLPVMP